jgi:hypothetical protein
MVRGRQVTRCLRYTKHSVWGLTATAKKENRFFIETHSPRVPCFSVYPRVFALVRPGSFQIRKSMGLGGRDSAGSKKSALSCLMGHSGQSIDCKKLASSFAYREWKHNGVSPGRQPKRVRYSLTRRRVVRSVQAHHSVSKLPG